MMMEKHKAYLRRRAQAQAAQEATPVEPEVRPAAPSVPVEQVIPEPETIPAHPETEIHASPPEPDQTVEGATTEEIAAEVAQAAPVIEEPLVLDTQLPVVPSVTITEETPAPAAHASVWGQLRTFPVQPAHLARKKIISANRENPAHVAFDVLRTRLLAALKDNGWTRVAVTSPTKNCGKSFTTVNLATSLSRQENCRTVVMDMDLRNPSLSELLGVTQPPSMSDFLSGKTQVEDHFFRPESNDLNIGQNVAFGLNGRTESFAAELLQVPETAAALDDMQARLNPDVVLFDLPPALYHDDVIAFRPHIDGVLLVIGGGVTKSQEIREVKRRLGDNLPLLGVVLNKAEGPSISQYSY